MKNYFPAKNNKYQYLQTNRSDYIGNIWASMGLDFQSNVGVMRVAPRLKINSTTATLTNMTGPAVGFKFFDNKFFTIAGTKPFRSTTSSATPATPFEQDTSSGTPSDFSSNNSDLETFNDQLFVTTNDEILRKAKVGDGTGAYTSVGVLTGSLAHMLTFFPKWNRLYVLDSGGVRSVDTSNTLNTIGDDYSLNLGTDGSSYPVCIKASSQSLWIGVINQQNRISRGCIYEWDGVSAGFTNIYTIDAQGCLSLVIKSDDTPYAMDSNGVMRKYDGSGFKEIGRLPNNLKLLKNINNTANDRFIHPNGLVSTPNDTLLALVDSFIDEDSDPDVVNHTILENFSSGIYEFSDENGCTKKYALTYNTYANSIITDYGQNKVSRVGGLSNALLGSSPSGEISNGTLMCGATYYIDATTTTNGIFFDDSNNTVQKKGYFITEWINSEEIEDKWERLWTTYRRLLGITDSIVYKYRLQQENASEGTITWINTTSFTVLNSSVDVSQFWTSGVGGEVEILQGTGSGSCVHITNAVNVAGTWTVTVDTVVTGVTTGTAKARFQKLIRLNPSITGQVRSWEQMAIGSNNIRIQIKGCMTFTGDGEFYKFALYSNSDIKINA